MKISRDDISAMEKRYRAQLVNSLPGLKSANLIGTADENGHPNCAIVSSVVHLGSDPPLLGMFSRPHSVERHTWENLKASGFYTINHVHDGIWKEAHQTSARYPRELSEFEATGLTPHWSDSLPAPYVREARLRIGMKFLEHHELPNQCLFIIGEIVEAEFPESALQADGHLLLEAIGTCGISGVDHYHQFKSLGRLAYAKPELPPRELKTSS
jgi:flavin reductase (DIM6/NTAB) family NADH-FMN oxidoreductase RutF